VNPTHCQKLHSCESSILRDWLCTLNDSANGWACHREPIVAARPRASGERSSRIALGHFYCCREGGLLILRAPNGPEVNPRGQRPRGYGSAARRVPAFEARDAGGVTPLKYRSKRRLGRRTEAGPRRVLPRVRPPRRKLRRVSPEGQPFMPCPRGNRPILNTLRTDRAYVDP